MILGNIEGKITTSEFSFVSREEPKNFEYVQVYHRVYDFVLCQVIEVERTKDKTIAHCQVIGYNDNGRIRLPRIPFDHGSEVLRAEDDFIASVISLDQAKVDETSSLAVIGHLEGRTIPVSLDLNKLLTKHIAILAMSGAGKSYTVGVLLEEILERSVPLLIIDPHGEYSGLARKNEEESEVELMPEFGIEPKGYNVSEYADTTFHPKAKPLRISTRLSATELAHLLPGKLSANQQAVLYSALKNLKDVTFDSLLSELELEESPAKYNIISTIEHLRSLPVFSSVPTPYAEMIKPGQATIINLRGMSPEVQEIITYKLCKDLFLLRKQNKVSPFFMVIEEAHNYCPERSFGETKASKVLRNIASEGRKFGLGLCVVSQRPARVDKSVLSQCSTQIILKVTNPNDLRAISNSAEGITSETEKEIKHLPVGSALVTGVTEVPLFVNIRPRRSSHGGRAVNILGSSQESSIESVDEGNLLDKIDEFSGQEVLPLIKPSFSAKDVEVMSEVPLVGVQTVLVPAYQFVCKSGEDSFKLLVELEKGFIVVDKDNFVLKRLPELQRFSRSELKMLQMVYQKGNVSWDELAALVGGSLSIEEDARRLLEREYLIESEGVRINDDFIFTKLQKVASFDEIVYESMSYHDKRTALLGLDEVKENLSRFTTIEDQFSCFIVRYEPLAKSEGYV